jgi:chemotaxis protein CheD
MTAERPPVRPRYTSWRYDHASLNQVPVRIGEIRVAEGESLLFTIGLGSCVAVVLYDSPIRLGGLAHVMLPAPANGRTDAPLGRYASTAVAALVAQLEAHGARRSRLSARLAGGASMFRDVLDGEGLRLGRRNVEAVRTELQQIGIPVAGEDVFGTYGRSVYLRTSDGHVLVTSVNQPDVDL